MPNSVLFIVIDCLRADHVSAYGYDRKTTPNIDELTKKGVIARRAITQSTYTVASAASMLTSVYPEVHGAIGFHDRLSDYPVTLPQYLSERGFDTACFEGMCAFSGPQKLERGFKTVYSFEPEKQRRGLLRASADEICSRFIDYIGRNESRNSPFFALLWFAEAHDPLFVPEEHRRYYRQSDGGISRIDQYDSAIRYVDYYIGEILEALDAKGLLDGTLIAITADHGEVFDEHYWLEGKPVADLLCKFPILGVRRLLSRNGFLDHLGIPPYEGVINVPLIIKFPRDRYKGVTLGLVELIDLFPTTLDSLNLDMARDLMQIQGKSIVPDLEGNLEGKRVAFTYTKPYHNGAAFTGVTNDEFKFVKSFPPNTSLKNISANPKVFIANRMWDLERLFKVGTSEKRDFGKECPEDLQALKRELLVWREKNATLREKLRLSKAVSRIRGRLRE